jgi:site-specific recombinase XerD
MGEHLVSQGIWTKNPLRWIKGPKMDSRSKIPRRIGKEDMKRLWEAADKKKPDTLRTLTLCVLSILYGTGLRRGELHRLDITGWDRDNGTLKVDGQKTGRERNTPVGPGVWKCIEAYLPVRQNRLEAAGTVNEKAFLIDRRGNRMSATAISKVVQVCSKAAGIPFINLHQFRHSCVSDLIESGVKLPDVQAMIGHAAIQTTMRYMDVTSGERTEAIKKHPINDFLNETRASSNDRRMAI